MERPKPNEGYALENDVSKYSISNFEENVKEYSIGLPKDADFKSENVANELIEKFGSSIKTTQELSSELNRVMDAVNRTEWFDALTIAQQIADSFEYAESRNITDYIYNKAMDAHDTQTWLEADSVAKYNASVDSKENNELQKQNKALHDKIHSNSKRISELEDSLKIMSIAFC